MKLLVVTTVGSTMFFFRDLIRELTANGDEVDIAANETIKELPSSYSDFTGRFFHISCTRNPFSTATLTAVRELKRIVAENHYDIVHCHTPVAGACARLACRKARRRGMRVLYTAHGFHFYKGAPLKNWLIYYPIEKLCSRMTDVLLTINREDFTLARSRFKAKRVEYVHGVGVDIDKFACAPAERALVRRELGIPENAFLLISVGELNPNKNQQIVICALAQTSNKDICYLIVGKGSMRPTLEQLASELGLENRVFFAGFREDVERLYKIADAEVFPSVREGLGLVAVEAMAAGLPVVSSDNRGTREYMPPYSETGFSGVCTSEAEFAAAFDRLSSDEELRRRMIEIGGRTVLDFSVRSINSRMIEIYGSVAEDIR